MTKKKREKLKKILNKLSPKPPTPKVEIREVVKVVEKIVEKPVIKRASNLPFMFALTKKFLSQKKAVSKVNDEIKDIKKSFEDKLDEVEKKIPEIPEKVDLAPLEKDIEELKEKIKKEKLDVLSRLADHGGGNMNRQILVNSSVISTKYTDINFLQGANATFTTADDNTNKRVDFTIQGTDTDTGITQLIGDVEAGPGNGSVVATLASIIATGTHGSATTVPVVTNDVKGRITAISSVAIAYPSVPAGVTSVIAGGGITVGNANPSTPIVERSSIAGDISIPQGSVIATLPNITNAATVGSSSVISQVTVNAKGQITSIAGVLIDFSPYAPINNPTFTGTLTAPTINTSVLTISSVLQGNAANFSGSIAALNLSGTNTGNVTLVGTPSYISISGQAITRNKITVQDDVSPFTSSTLSGTVTDETGSGALVFGTSPSFTTNITTPLVIGGTGTTDDLILQSTSGVGTTGADIIFKAGNNGATEVGRMTNDADWWINGASLGFSFASGSAIAGPNSASFYGNSGDFHMISNGYTTLTGTGWKYMTNGTAANLYMFAGDTVFRNAVSGTAGNDITWTETMRISTSGNVGIGDATPTEGKLVVNQGSTTAAIPSLYLNQADVSEEMIEFNTTIGTGNAIEAAGAKVLTTTHFIKITIPGGLTRYIPCGTIA